MANYWDPDNNGILVIDYPGGCPMVVDPHVPHLGGNMRGGDGATDYTADLWPWLVKKFSPRTVLDVGCAEGHALRAFQALGCKVVGVEGLWQNARRCEVPVIVHDLTMGPIITEGVDLIWCCDVVEHVEERYVDNIIRTLRCAPVCVLVHGTDEHVNSGWHHVNNKPASYWVERMASAGMIYDEAVTAEALASAPRGWFQTSGKIYRRKQ